MATKTATRTNTQRKPVPAPVRPQSNAATKKPAPPSVKPQTAQKKKPVPPQVRPQSTARTNSGTVSKAPSKAASTKGPSSAGGLQAGQAIQSKPQAEQAPKADNWISRMVQGQVQRVGDYAGGYINNIGNGVNKIGEGIGGKYVLGLDNPFSPA